MSGGADFPERPKLQRWRVVQDGEGEAAENMARDEAILNAVEQGEAPPTIRFYQWSRPSVSLGRFQSIERTMDRDNCTRLGISLVRRITGGRGILHGDDLTVSIVCPVQALGLGSESGISALYRHFARGFLEAFAALEIEAVVGAEAKERVREVRGDCFATISQADVIEARSGRKLLGSALHRRDTMLLQQISIPLDTEARKREYGEIARAVFRGPTALNAQAEGGLPLELERLTVALCMGLEFALKIELNAGQITAWEQ